MHRLFRKPSGAAFFDVAALALSASLDAVEKALPKSKAEAKRKLAAAAKAGAKIAGEALKSKVGEPLLEDAGITVACLQERMRGNFIAPKEVAPGTVVICALAKSATHHSGIWLGDGTIAELDGDGNYRAVDLQTFLRGNAGECWRAGTFAYAACDSDGNALGADEVAERARELLGETTNYSLDSNNCHRFSTACHGGETKKIFRLMRTFSIGELVARVLAFHGVPALRWLPVGKNASAALPLKKSRKKTK